jgi:hypothetical protein
MSFAALQLVHTFDFPTTTDKALLDEIAHYCNAEMQAWPAAHTLAQKVGASLRTVRRYLADYKALGLWMPVAKRAGGVLVRELRLTTAHMRALWRLRTVPRRPRRGQQLSLWKSCAKPVDNSEGQEFYGDTVSLGGCHGDTSGGDTVTPDPIRRSDQGSEENQVPVPLPPPPVDWRVELERLRRAIFGGPVKANVT